MQFLDRDFFNLYDTATHEIYTLSLHDALPIFDLAFHDHILDRFGADYGIIQSAAVSAEFTFRGEAAHARSEEHTSELQSLRHLVCRLLLEKKNYSCNNMCTTSVYSTLSMIYYY